MSTLMKRSSLQAAERRIMADLMNSFLSEQLLALEDHPFIDFATAPAPFRRLYKGYDSEEHNHNVASRYRLHTQGVLCLVETGVRQGTQWVQGSPIYEEKTDGSWVLLDTPAEVGRAVLQRALSDKAYAQPGVAEFLVSLDIAVEQYALGWEQVQYLSANVPASAYKWFIKGSALRHCGIVHFTHRPKPRWDSMQKM